MKPRKRFIILAFVLLLAGGSVIAFFYHVNSAPTGAARPTSKDLTDFAAQHNLQAASEIYQAPAQANAVKIIDPSSRVRLAIGWLGLPDDESNQRVSDLITADLSATKNLDLVDRQSLDALLHEQQMSLAGVVRANSAIRLGKLLRADWFLLGTATVIHGSNYLVERVVDTRTGQWQDSQAFPVESDPSQMAANLAAFVRQCRTDASHARPKTYLAVGEFRDVSEKGMHPEFPQRLTASLIAAFHDNTNITMLERENVEALTQEFRLDLAGLTSESTTNSPKPLQWAYWTVDGLFQFSESTGGDVQLHLSVWQVFNSLWETNLTGPPNETIFHQANEAVAARLAQAGPFVLPPTRRGEIALQLETAETLSGMNGTAVGNPGYVLESIYLRIDDEDKEKRTYDLERAIGTFKTVLLLDPENQEAKIYLGNCLWHPYIDRKEEAFNYFREVAEAPLAGRWKGLALMDAMLCYPNRPEAAEWVRQAQALRPFQSNIFESQFQGAKTPQGTNSFEQDLTLSTRDLARSLQDDKFFGNWPGIGNFLAHFQSEPADGMKKLIAVLSTLKEQYPDVAPYLVLAALTAQKDTNNPFLPDLLQSMARLSEHPDQVLDPGAYFTLLTHDGYEWCYQRKQFSLAEQMIAAKDKASVSSNALTLTLGEKLRWGYAFKMLERWQDAMAIFTNLPPSPLDPTEPGPWEHWTEAYLPGPDINECRKKLGAPEDPHLRNPVDAGVNFLFPALFACSDGAVWVAVGSKLYELDYNLHTNGIYEMPTDGSADTLVCAGPSQIWIGTRNVGLVEFNKATHQCRLINERDGLYRDDIGALCLQGDTLWIGYTETFGRNGPGGGGVTQLDLRTRKMTSFGGVVGPFQPTNWSPQLPVGIVTDASGQVFPPTFPAPHPYSSGGMQPFLTQILRADKLFVASFFNSRKYVPRGTNTLETANNYGLIVRNGDGPWEQVGESAGLPAPNVNAMQWDGHDLWLGGWGYLAVMDLGKMTVRKTIFIHQNVSHLELAGGYAWIRGGSGGGWENTAVFRIPLSVAK